MTLIVADNSPLNILIRLGQTAILPRLFAQVVIPPEVEQEMRHPNAPLSILNFISSPPSWLVVQRPKNLLVFPHLDPGESSAISLAIELQALLMVDENDGRAAALSYGLQIIGAIGVLERAANAGFIQDLASVYSHIKPLGFHVSDKILQDSLARHLAFRQASRH